MVYVLELENGKFYVGYTRSKSRRIQDHFKGYGSKWTKLHKPIRVLEWLRGGRLLERKKTLEYMQRYGIDSVRGYQWCQLKHECVPVPLRPCMGNGCLGGEPPALRHNSEADRHEDDTDNWW